jgi:predicted aspartyl protease
MANILTAAQAANALRCEVTDPAMLDLMPQVDEYIKTATGRNWAADTTIDPVAIAAARMLLVMWYENPAMVGSQTVLSYGLGNALTQLEAKALILAG